MKIAHINYLPYDNHIGVNKKIQAQALSALKNKIDIDFYILNSFEEKQEKNFIVRKIKSSFFIKKFFRFHIIENLVDLEKYDFIILRYPGVDFSAISFIIKYGHKIITEHHTNEIGEILSGKKNLFVIYRYLLEKYFSPLFLKYIEGFIGVTQEIIEVENKKIKFFKPNKVISNGILVSSIKFTKFNIFNAKELNIIFVASYFASWHGLNLILDDLEIYKGEIKLILNLVGDISEQDRNRIKELNKNKNKNIDIKILGRKYSDELDEIFAISTIAISTMAISTIAISTKSMKEACPLKTREYIARGIPFIYGYKDVDLNGNEEFALKIDKFDIYKVIEFAKKISDRDGLSDKMRKFAINDLDWSIKVRQMYEFCEELKNLKTKSNK
jgi:hypothetical protein